jgi:hypothetical protein
MADTAPQDARKFFMLPQAPEGAGYYVYGTPAQGAAQYTHPTMMTLLLMVEREWALIDTRQFGIGNISVADGAYSATAHTARDWKSTCVPCEETASA